MKRASPKPMDETQVSGGSIEVRVSGNNQPPVPVTTPKKNHRELGRVVSPLNFSFTSSNDLDRNRTSSGIRSPGLTTNRSGQIVQSGTLHRAMNMNPLSKNKSSDHLVRQFSTPSSQNPTAVRSGNPNKNGTGNGQEGTLTRRDAVASNDAGRKATTLDRSWRTRDDELNENLPHVGGSFSFDLERDAQVLLDLIYTIEENGADSSRSFCSSPSTPGFEGDQMSTIRRKTPQKSSSFTGDGLTVQRVADEVSEFDEKPAMAQKTAVGGAKFNETSSGNVKLQNLEAGLREWEKTFNEAALGVSKVQPTPGWPYNGIDQTLVSSKKFSVADNDPPPGHGPSRNVKLNGAIGSLETRTNGVVYDHLAQPVLRSGVSTGVSAQRGYASDSEDPMDWLEQQRAKLKLKIRREGDKVDPRLLQELKIRQKILGRTPTDEEGTSFVFSVSSDAAQNAAVVTQRPEMHHGKYGHGIATQDLNTGWSDSSTLRQTYDQSRAGGSDRRAETPEFDQNYGGGHFAKETQWPGYGNRSGCATNGVPLSTTCRSLDSTVYEANPTRAMENNSESGQGRSNTEPPSEQQEVHETCVSKKIISQHRGYSPTRLDALIEAAAAAATGDCDSSPSSSQSTEISDSGYRTASASSANDEFPLTTNTTGRKVSNNRIQEVSRTSSDGQAGVGFNMALPNFRHQTNASADSSSKINERFNSQSRTPTVANQMEIPGTVPKQPWHPVFDSQQFLATSQPRPTFTETTAVGSGVSGNGPRTKTLEEEIEDLLAFGEQLRQKAEHHRPTEIQQQPHQDQRRPFVSAAVQDPFLYSGPAKRGSDISHQIPFNLAEEQNQMLRVAQTPSSGIDNPNLYPRQPMNVSVDQPMRTTTTTGAGFPTEIRTFNNLRIETYQPNRRLAEPSCERREIIQATNGGHHNTFSQNRDKPTDRDLFVRQPTAMNNNNYTLPNNVTRHDRGVNLSQNTEQQNVANRQFAGEDWNRMGHCNAEKDATKYATNVQAGRAQPSKLFNVNGFPNHAGSSGGQDFQYRKTNGSESAAGVNGFGYPNSVRRGNEPWTGEEDQRCVILYSEDGRQILIPQSYLDSTSTMSPSSESVPSSGGAVREHRVENVSSRLVKDSRVTQMGEELAAGGGEGQTIDKYGLVAPQSFTIRRQVAEGPVPQQQHQQPVGGTRMENIRSGGQQEPMQSPIDDMQRIHFYSQNSDSVFASPPPAAEVSMNQVVAHLRGEASRTSSFSSSVTGQSSPSLSVDRSSGGSASPNRVADGVEVAPQYVMQCVRDACKEWYKPEISRDDVVNILKDKSPGSFIIRNSTTYAGDFALAVKVAEIPIQHQQKTGDVSEDFVRHFLIESKPNGIRLKGRSNEPVFASLTSFVFQHALTPLSLPHRLLLPTDTSSVGSGTGSVSRSSTSTSISKAQEEISSILIYIGAVDLESLTGPEALGKAVSQIEAQKTTPATTTIVNFLLSSQGIVLTDTKRKLFFRRHYPLSCISYCGIDAGDRRWTEDVDGGKKNTERRIFGFVSRKRGSSSAGSQTSSDGNECHLFADYETGYPADSVVDLINKILGENGHSVIK